MIRRSIPFVRSLRTTIIVLFILPVVFSIVMTAFLLNLVIKEAFDNEVGKRLTSIALTTAAQMADSNLVLLTEGAEKTQVYRKLRSELLRLRELNSIERIRVFRLDNTALLDTREDVEIGTPYISNQFDEYELEQVKQGRAMSSTYFEGDDGRPHKTGYAPIQIDKDVRAIVGIEASWDYFSKLKEVSRAAFWVGLVGVSIVILIGVVFSQTILFPIRSLAGVAEEIGNGNYQVSFPQSIHFELKQLVLAVSKMKNKIVNRERDMNLMLYGVAHEVRNPLAGIKLYAGILKDEYGDRIEIQRIDREINYIEKVVQEFMLYAKSAAPDPIRLEEVVLEEYLSELLALFSSEIQRSQIHVQVFRGNVEKGRFDAAIIKSVLTNLIKNSIQAMPAGGSLTLRWAEKDQDLIFEVKDTGPGIDAADQEKIFIPFFTTKAKGSGLGLSLARRLIERHRGRVEIVSEAGKGTLVRVFVPKSYGRSDTLGEADNPSALPFRDQVETSRIGENGGLS